MYTLFLLDSSMESQRCSPKTLINGLLFNRIKKTASYKLMRRFID